MIYGVQYWCPQFRRWLSKRGFDGTESLAEAIDEAVKVHRDTGYTARVTDSSMRVNFQIGHVHPPGGQDRRAGSNRKCCGG